MRQSARIPTLRDRVSMLATAVAAACLVAGALLWGMTTREAIHEEVEAAAHVAEQWLTVTRAEHADAAGRLAMLSAVGRLRANQLEVFDDDGTLRYRSPEPTYKAGREAPAWFAALLAPRFKAREWSEGNLTLRLQPDTSRAVLDAWDAMVFGAGWAIAGLILLAVAVRHATARIVAPLAVIAETLRATADGRFDQRIRPLGSAEFNRLAGAYNHMAAHLEQTLARNARLEEDQAFVRAVNQRLEDERRAIARELHDEFAQSITAMRAIAGAIAQRSADNAALHGSAQALIAMTCQVQDNVRGTLAQLRSNTPDQRGRLDEAIAEYATKWARCYPALCVTQAIERLPAALPEAFCLTVLRLLQEALTNVARHAGAHRVHITLRRRAEHIELVVGDDGRGFDTQAHTERYGLQGMRERVALWNGHWRAHCPATGGCTITVDLPLPTAMADIMPSRHNAPEKHL